mgnify:CR=1 FL=1
MANSEQPDRSANLLNWRRKLSVISQIYDDPFNIIWREGYLPSIPSPNFLL